MILALLLSLIMLSNLLPANSPMSAIDQSANMETALVSVSGVAAERPMCGCKQCPGGKCVR